MFTIALSFVLKTAPGCFKLNYYYIAGYILRFILKSSHICLAEVAANVIK